MLIIHFCLYSNYSQNNSSGEDLSRILQLPNAVHLDDPQALWTTSKILIILTQPPKHPQGGGKKKKSLILFSSLPLSENVTTILTELSKPETCYVILDASLTN